MTYQNNILRRVREQRILHDVTLELTYACNLDCFYCYNDRDKKGETLSIEQYQKLLGDLAQMQTLHLMLTGGEPMVHPHFFDIGRMAKDLGFLVRVRTNGHSLSRRMANRVLNEVDPYIVEVTLHGASAEVHDKQTRVPGSFDRLLRNISASTAAGLRLSVVATPTLWNQHQIDDMFALCDTLRVPLRFQGPVAPRDNGDCTPLSIQPAESTWDHITRLLEKRRGPPTDDQQTNMSSQSVAVSDLEQAATCGVGVAGVDIDPYGNVNACMHLQEAAGNIHDQSIEEIWNHSPLFARARTRAVDAAKRFVDAPAKQLGAPLFCLAVEENLQKGSCGSCHGSCK